MILDPPAIEAYKAILNTPESYGLKMKPFKTYFVESETVTPQDVLASEVLAVNNRIPKLVAYILFQEHFPHLRGMAKNGCFGYKIKFQNQSTNKKEPSVTFSKADSIVSMLCGLFIGGAIATLAGIPSDFAVFLLLGGIGIAAFWNFIVK